MVERGLRHAGGGREQGFQKLADEAFLTAGGLDEGVQDAVVFQTDLAPDAQEDLAHNHNRTKALLGLIVERKALKQLSGTEESRVLNHLKASGLRQVLLLNFGSVQLEYKSFVRHPQPSADESERVHQ
jgi:hypothetical protein